MPIDSVHDIQKVYRELLQCMARPGKIADIRESAAKVDVDPEYHPTTFLVLQTLLDAEVTFHVLGDRETSSRKITNYTFATCTDVENADFIIVPAGTSEGDWLDAMSRCKSGTLENPQQSATWVMESGPLGADSGWYLSGPGILGETDAPFRFSEALVRMRNKKSQEFPVGIDLIFTDDSGQITCIPRTTVITAKEESSWVM